MAFRIELPTLQNQGPVASAERALTSPGKALLASSKPGAIQSADWKCPAINPGF